MTPELAHAIVRPPAPNFSEGITTSGLGPPDCEKALEQHEHYCAALEQCGLTVTKLPPDPRFPDSCFVEDTAVLTPEVAIIARPGAESRRGETDGIREALGEFNSEFRTIEAPGTLDGGDVLQTDREFIIGISARTNEEGARQLAAILEEFGYRSTKIDVWRNPNLLHLKSGISYVGNDTLVIVSDLVPHKAFQNYRWITPSQEEEYSANCLRVNEKLLLALGYSEFEASLEQRSISTLMVDVSEFRKMDGGLSCLSLRF